MTSGTRHYVRQGQTGFSLIELLMVVILTTFSMLAISELLYLNHAGSYRVTNMMETTSAVRNAIDRLGKDIREGRSIGDVAGQDVQTTPVTNPPTYYSQGSASFPTAKNALYGTGGVPGAVPTPGGGWTAAWTQPTIAAPWTITSQRLIVQVPIFDTYTNSAGGAGGHYGCPTEIPASAISAGVPAQNQDNVETHVYQIVPDPDQVNHKNEFDLQVLKVPGYAVAGIYSPNTVSSSPQTVLTGIVGPMPPGVTANASGPSSQWPAVFSFIDKTGTGIPTVPPLTDGDVPNYTGVVINLEVRKGSSTVKNQPPAYLAFKQEIFMRNNALATTTGQPSAITGDQNQWNGN